jgi:hypothetical protein
MKLLQRLVLSIHGAALLGGLAAAPPAEKSETKIEGVLIDKACSYKAETRVVPGGGLAGGILQAYIHTRKELLTPDHRTSGYGIFTYEDRKFLAFDAAGNRKALAFIQASKKEDDYRVEVTGQVEGDTMKVTSIRMLP